MDDVMRIQQVINMPMGIIPEENRSPQVAVYCLISTGKIDRAFSIKLRMAHYSRLFRENPNWKYVGCYIDDIFPGTNALHRRNFQMLMKDAMDGKIDLIVTKSLYQFAGNIADTLMTIRNFAEKRIEVYFEKENIRTFDCNGKMLLSIIASLAQEESRSVSENSDGCNETEATEWTT